MIEQLFMETVWQYYAGPGEYRLFGNLPICLNRRFPCRLVIGRKRNNEPLRTAWKKSPRTVSDRDSLAPNAPIETCFENWAKSSFDPKYFPMIREDLNSVQLPLELYDP